MSTSDHSSEPLATPGRGDLLTILVPIFNEKDVISHLIARLSQITSQHPSCDWEIVFVNDGSTDNTVEQITTLTAGFTMEVSVISFSRNFGHQAALLAGLAEAKGDAIVILDADLQDPPELITDFLRLFHEGYEVVYGVRRNREGAAWKLWCYHWFYRLFQALAEVPIPLDAGDFGLISRRVARYMTAQQEADIFLRGLRSWVGFKQIGVPYDRPSRVAGETKYTLAKLGRLAASAMFGFSSLPLRFSTVIGMLSLCSCIAYGTFVLAGKLFFDSSPQGWTSLILVVLFLGGTQLLFIGILGEYIGRIYKQVLQRPPYIVSDHWNNRDLSQPLS